MNSLRYSVRLGCWDSSSGGLLELRGGGENNLKSRRLLAELL